MGLDKILERYNPEHDIGPDAPVPWYVHELARRLKQLQAWADDTDSAVSQLVRYYDKLHARISKLEVECGRESTGNAGTDEVKPAPCPWCGSDTSVTSLAGHWWVQCCEEGCEAAGPTAVNDHIAVDAWNGVVTKCVS